MLQVFKKVIGSKLILISSISFLSLIFSLFIHSVIASSVMPTANPPDGNVKPPIYNDTDMNDEMVATINRQLSVTGMLNVMDNLTATKNLIVDQTLLVENGIIADNLKSCGKIYSDATGNFLCGTDETGSGTIPANSIDSSQIIDESLTANDLAPNSVGTSEVIDNSLTANDLAAGSVGTSEIISSQVQRRVTNSCSRGISSISENGAVSCVEGNTSYEGAGWIEGVPSGRYQVTIQGRVGRFEGTEDDIKVEAASPCGVVTQIFGYYPIDGRHTVSPSFIFNLSCSACSTQALQDMCGMMGFTLRGYTDFIAAGCSVWNPSFCWPDSSVFADKITAIRLN